MYSSLARLCISVSFCFGLSACLLFFCFIFYFFIYLECSTQQSRVLAIQQKVENSHCLHSLTQERLMHGNFCIILKSHFFICDFIDIDECKGNHSCHENANCTNTNGSYVCDCQPGYNGNGQNCTGEFGITRKCGHGLFLLVRSFFFWLYSVFCAPVAKQEQFIAYALDILCCTNVNKFEK